MLLFGREQLAIAFILTYECLLFRGSSVSIRGRAYRDWIVSLCVFYLQAARCVVHDMCVTTTRITYRQCWQGRITTGLVNRSKQIGHVSNDSILQLSSREPCCRRLSRPKKSLMFVTLVRVASQVIRDFFAMSRWLDNRLEMQAR